MRIFLDLFGFWAKVAFCCPSNIINCEMEHSRAIALNHFLDSGNQVNPQPQNSNFKLGKYFSALVLQTRRESKKNPYFLLSFYFMCSRYDKSLDKNCEMTTLNKARFH